MWLKVKLIYVMSVTEIISTSVISVLLRGRFRVKFMIYANVCFLLVFKSAYNFYFYMLVAFSTLYLHSCIKWIVFGFENGSLYAIYFFFSSMQLVFISQV